MHCFRLFHFSRLLLVFLLFNFSATAMAEPPIKQSLAPMLKKIMPAVVNIAAKGESEDNANYESHFESLGSGVILDAKKGYIVTNAHVVNGAHAITITLQDGRTFTAKQIGVDKPSDIALLQIEAKNLIEIALANSDDVEIGDFVVAIGSPYGLTQTATSGIISAKQRNGLGLEGYEDFIQTDAPINPGNSGGALVNVNGEVVGINTAILGPDGSNIGIGFAIPSDMVKNVTQQLAKYGQVDRGIMGVLVQSLNPALNEGLGLAEETEGAVVTQVLPDSPADNAKFKVGDVITAINGKPVNSASSVSNSVGFIRKNSTIVFQIIRQQKPMELKLKTETSEAYKEKRQQANPFLAGVSFSNITAQSPSHGFVRGIEVLQVAPESKAWASGLRPNDVIVSLNNQVVTSIEDLNAILAKKPKTVLLNVLRANGALFLVIK